MVGAMSHLLGAVAHGHSCVLVESLAAAAVALLGTRPGLFLIRADLIGLFASQYQPCIGVRIPTGV